MADRGVPVVILCGGRGKRLNDQTQDVPKPLVQIGDRPLLSHIMENFSRSGFSDFILCLGYKSKLIKEYFIQRRWQERDIEIKTSETGFRVLEDEPSEWRVRLFDTGKKTHKAKRVASVADSISENKFFLTYGDGLADIPPSELLNRHEEHNSLATMTGTQTSIDVGIIRTNDGTVTEFREKPPINGLTNAGFFVFDRDGVRYFDQNPQLEKGVVNSMLADNELSVYKHDGFFMGVDTYKDLSRARELWEENNVLPWAVSLP